MHPALSGDTGSKNTIMSNRIKNYVDENGGAVKVVKKILSY